MHACEYNQWTQMEQGWGHVLGVGAAMGRSMGGEGLCDMLNNKELKFNKNKEVPFHRDIVIMD